MRTTAPLDPKWWARNGGEATLKSYNNEVPSNHLDWVKNLPTMHVDLHRIFAHAEIDPTNRWTIRLKNLCFGIDTRKMPILAMSDAMWCTATRQIHTDPSNIKIEPTSTLWPGAPVA
jgi:hypothetical protein